MTMRAIQKTLAQLEAKRRGLADEMQLTADLALPLHPWRKNQGKFVHYLGYLFRVEALACAPGNKGELLFLVHLQRHSPKLRRPLAHRPLLLNIAHLDVCEVVS